MVWTSQSGYGAAFGLLKSDGGHSEQISLAWSCSCFGEGYSPPHSLVTFPFAPGLEAGFSRSGVGDLMALDDVHFRETTRISQAQKFSRRKAPTTVGTLDERLL